MSTPACSPAPSQRRDGRRLPRPTAPPTGPRLLVDASVWVLMVFNERNSSSPICRWERSVASSRRISSSAGESGSRIFPRRHRPSSARARLQTSSALVGRRPDPKARRARRAPVQRFLGLGSRPSDPHRCQQDQPPGVRDARLRCASDLDCVLGLSLGLPDVDRPEQRGLLDSPTGGSSLREVARDPRTRPARPLAAVPYPAQLLSFLGLRRAHLPAFRFDL